MFTPCWHVKSLALPEKDKTLWYIRWIWLDSWFLFFAYLLTAVFQDITRAGEDSDKGAFTWTDLHTWENICKYVNGFAQVCKIWEYSWNLHLVETKFKFQIAYTQILHICKSVHVNGNQNLLTWVCSLVPHQHWNDVVSRLFLRIFQFWHLIT